MVLMLLALLAAEGRPLFYWGARAAVIEVESSRERTEEARATEVHAALDGGELVVRVTFDRPVREALYLPDGAPVSGRLRAVLYVDSDDDRRTGLDEGTRELKTGADYRLELGALTVGGDVEEKRGPAAFVTAVLVSVAADGRRRTLWRGDDGAAASRISAHGDAVEVRLPAGSVTIGRSARLVLTAGARSWDGRLRAP